uniref:Peptidase S1 domain-containing protein n=1 Tax=Athene cunicularia TaxID=194338 RepID=A0A663NDF9_ATHCN
MRCGNFYLKITCGRDQFKKNRIVGGEDARSGKWPWQASLQMGAYGHMCGASVVSNRWLISAAHCFLDSDSVRYEEVILDSIFPSESIFPSGILLYSLWF